MTVIKYNFKQIHRNQKFERNNHIKVPNYTRLSKNRDCYPIALKEHKVYTSDIRHKQLQVTR